LIGAYTGAPPLAWSGWRLRIPGGPAGGQYHGFLGPDSLGWRGVPGGPPPALPPSPWQDVWGGTALKEGQSLSDYVTRGPAEMRPRANASGGVNVVSAFQTQKTAGYAEAPGNYRGVGATPNFVACPEFDCSPIISRGPAPCFTPICGATNFVAQPAPPSGPGGTLVPYSAPPVSPAPSPTVSATPTSAATPADPITAWLGSSTIFPGVENLWLALGAGAAAYFLLKGRK
jgi:hypothetical protein